MRLSREFTLRTGTGAGNETSGTQLLEVGETKEKTGKGLQEVASDIGGNPGIHTEVSRK